MIDPFELARAETLLQGYTARWFDESREHYEVLAVEVETTAPLRNPNTGAAATKARLGGKLDAFARDRRTGIATVIEHKSAGEDLGLGGSYWRRLILDSQLSTYIALARSLLNDPAAEVRVLYDVIRKPTQRQLLATPIESRKYTKPTKTEPTPRLYANQRETDETADEYKARLVGVISKEPEAFFLRGDVVRLAEEEREAALDVWYTYQTMRAMGRDGIAPRNPDACMPRGRVCDYWPVCSGEASIDDPRRYVKKERRHEELSADDAAFFTLHRGTDPERMIRDRRLPILSNSEIKTFRACPRQHRFRYVMQMKPAVEDENLRFGTLVHRGLEAWWKALQKHENEATTNELALAALATGKESA